MAQRNLGLVLSDLKRLLDDASNLIDLYYTPDWTNNNLVTEKIMKLASTVDRIEKELRDE